MKKRLIQVIAILGGVCILSLGGLALGNKISNKHNKEMVKVEEVNVVDDTKVNDESKTNINNDTSNEETEKESSKVVEKNNNTSNNKEEKEEENKVTEKNNNTSKDEGKKRIMKLLIKIMDHKKDDRYQIIKRK